MSNSSTVASSRRQTSLRVRLLVATLGGIGLALVMVVLPGLFLVLRTISNDVSSDFDEAVSFTSLVVQTPGLSTSSTIEASMARFAELTGTVIHVQSPTREFIVGGSLGETMRQRDIPMAGGGFATISLPKAQISNRFNRVWLPTAALIGLAVALAVPWSLWRARKLSQPVASLVVRAELLGAGDVRQQPERSGVRELDAVADVLDAAAQRMAWIIQAERQAAADASHQLRTPLTALSMRLEEIAELDDPELMRAEAAMALEQVARLADVVAETVRASRRSARESAAVPVKLDALFRQALRTWRPLFAEAGRQLVMPVGTDAVVMGRAGAIASVLTTLLENSLRHGQGRVTVSIRRAMIYSAEQNLCVVEVRDELGGIPEDLAPRIFERHVSGGQGGGTGLALARATADSMTGRLELSRAAPPTFSFFLPFAPDTTSQKPNSPSG